MNFANTASLASEVETEGGSAITETVATPVHIVPVETNESPEVQASAQTQAQAHPGLKPIQEINNFNVVLFGRTGVGKSSLLGCISGRPEHHITTWRDSTMYNRPRDFQINKNHTLKIYDTKGFTGNLAKDLVIFNQLMEDVTDTTARVNKVFLCFNASRFTDMDHAVLNMVEKYLTQEFRSVAHVIVTHFPKHTQTPEMIATIKQKFKFLEPNDDEALSKRITFVDLIDVNRFRVNNSEMERHAHDYVVAEWESTKHELHAIICSSDATVQVRKFKKLNVITEMFIVYFNWIILALAVIIILYLWVNLSETLAILQDKEAVVKKLQAAIDSLNKAVPNQGGKKGWFTSFRDMYAAFRA